MPYYNIALKPDTIATIANRKDDASVRLAEDLLDEKNDVLGIMSHYCKYDRGQPAFGSLGVNPELLLIRENLTGTVVVAFQEQAFYGCKDKDIQEDYDVEIPFRISLQNKTLTLDVPETARVNDWHGN